MNSLRIALDCACAISSAVLLGVAAGCGLGVFIYKGPMFSKVPTREGRIDSIRKGRQLVAAPYERAVD